MFPISVIYAFLRHLPLPLLFYLSSYIYGLSI